jgi:nucleotidyltransferase/DNA polymerase involved in DNA repair
MPLRKIIHVDMDAFFASVKQRDNLALRVRPSGRTRIVQCGRRSASDRRQMPNAVEQITEGGGRWHLLIDECRL